VCGLAVVVVVVVVVVVSAAIAAVRVTVTVTAVTVTVTVKTIRPCPNVIIHTKHVLTAKVRYVYKVSACMFSSKCDPVGY
jgi:hypothetical protein